MPAPPMKAATANEKGRESPTRSPEQFILNPEVTHEHVYLTQLDPLTTKPTIADTGAQPATFSTGVVAGVLVHSSST
jgi:hypothetical protein